jgi:hypothetical protein
VGSAAPERGAAVDDEGSDGRPITGGGQRHRISQGRIVDARDSPQGVADDVELELRLHLRRDVLPPATAASRAGERTRRRDAIGGRVEYRGNSCPQHVGTIGRDLHFDAFTRECTIDEHDPAVGRVSERIAARDHPFAGEFHAVIQLCETAEHEGVARA